MDSDMTTDNAVKQLISRLEYMHPPDKHLLCAMDQITLALNLERKITDAPHMNIGPMIKYWADSLEAGIWPPE
jgi:hypothetical protein